MNIFAWIDIPVENLERAIDFYGKLCGRSQLHSNNASGQRTATLYFEEGKVGGSLVETTLLKPGYEGTHVYMNAGRTLLGLHAWMKKVEAAGGEIVVPASPLGEFGYYATFKDSEGNLISLFAEK
ncbi:MAG: VOC family protein [bacterium]|nr:VOC family protein [bacterium]